MICSALVRCPYTPAEPAKGGGSINACCLPYGTTDAGSLVRCLWVEANGGVGTQLCFCVGESGTVVPVLTTASESPRRTSPTSAGRLHIESVPDREVCRALLTKSGDTGRRAVVGVEEKRFACRFLRPARLPFRAQVTGTVPTTTQTCTNVWAIFFFKKTSSGAFDAKILQLQQQSRHLSSPFLNALHLY